MGECPSSCSRPEVVAREFGRWPTLAGLLPPPDSEQPSEAFPGLRKSAREVYRLLANTHYPHLVDALDDLETAHAAGCRFGHMLKTQSRQQFQSHLAEALIAEHLLSRGYEVRTIPTASGPSPDLHVRGDGVDMAIEVFTPREWLDIDAWMNELQDFLKNADVPSNYRAGAHTKVGDAVGPDAVRTPEQIAAMLRATHEAVFEEAKADVLAALAAETPFERTCEHQSTDLVTTVTLEHVRRSDGEGLSRFIATSPPGYIAYSPAGVFARVVARARRKARRRQAEAIRAATRAMLVNLTPSVAEDLLHEPHTAEAEGVLQSVDPSAVGLDLFAYCVRAKPKGVNAMFYVYDDERLTEAKLRAMFGSG